jgi:regulation of enolase protein 1 (concanavalin A-like superfamily)
VQIRKTPDCIVNKGVRANNLNQVLPGASKTFVNQVLVILSLLAWSTILHASLPSGWLDADIGSPGLFGSATYSTGGWTITGGGKDLCTSDQSHFVWKPLTGDAVITAQVVNIANAPFGEAGVMLRNDLTQGTIEVSVLATTNNGVTFQWRSAVGASCSYQVAIGFQNLSVPVWVQLVRSGNNFSGFLSTNGVDFIQIGSTQTVPLNLVALGGLAVCAGDNSTLAMATFSNVTIPQPTFGLYRELWTGLSPAAGNSLAALTNTSSNPNWPNNPNANFTAVFTAFETETNTGMNYYGQRLRAFIVPPMSGSYTFWIASADTSQLSLSSDETPANAKPIAWVNTFTAPRQWNKEPNQQSAPINLLAGHRYYIQALMQEGTDADNLAVRWQLPNGTNEEPIAAISPAGTWLIPFTGLDAPPGIYQQPASLTVSDGLDATFSVLVTNPAPVTYQWLRNGIALTDSNAASPVYILSHSNPTNDNNQKFSCVVSTASGSITSSPALLTIIPDTTPPTVVRTLYENPTNVLIVFSEPVEVSSATNPANYVFTNGLPVFSASLGPDNSSVTLTTAALTSGTSYFILITGIRDRATTPNTIAANTLVTFFAGPYTVQGIGGPTPAGTIFGNGGGFDVGGGGKNIGGASDQFQFVWQATAGDFDMAVRINSFAQTDAFAQAGLMARDDLTSSGRFAAVLATPSLNGAYFEYRATAGAATATSGNLRVNYPYTWLRLQRISNQFTGFGSYDGNTWQQLGTISLALTNPVYLGMGVCSHTSTQTALVQFRNFGTVTNTTVGTVSNPRELPGPSSRKSPIAITEIMYKPAPRADTNNLEFIEIYNSNPWFHDISGYQLVANNLNYTFPAGTILPGGAFLVIAASPQSIQNVYGINNVVGPYTGSLKKSDTLKLLDEVGNVLLTVPYSNVPPWPVAADGVGHSLVLNSPTYGEADPRAWDISDVVGGSPGEMEAYRPSPLCNVVINEFLAHTDPPEYDYVELYNHANQPVDISGCILTDDPTTNKFVIPSGTVIPARGFVYYSETNMNFRLNDAGETIYFENPDQSRVLDAVHFGGQENGVATGRWPDGANDFYRLTALTPGAPNSAIRPTDVVINELMYNPISGNDDDQYVELYNRSTNSVDLGGWQLSGAVSYTIASNAILLPDSYLVIGRNAARLRTIYSNLNLNNCVGDFAGKLSHNGELLALTMPDTVVQTNKSGVVATNLIHIAVNELTYGAGGRWGQWSSGGGSSLELVDPNSNNRLAANWADSDETQKSSWTNIETTGVLDNGANYESSILHAQIGLLDVGECLVDNVEVRAGATGPNLVLNPDFETGGLSNWSLQGDHVRSSIENSGYASSYSLHLRCDDRLWTGVNSCQANLSSNTLGGGQTATLRFKARWLRGWPEVLLRLNGNWLETTGPLPIPANLGTPGARNSRFIANVGPAIYQVTHNPPVPVAAQPVVVSARVHDTDGLQGLTLFYRIDPSPNYTSVAMKDDGTGGDALAGDGIYSATIPGQNANNIVAFYVAAQDKKLATTRFPAVVTANAPIPECVVMFGDSNPAGSFGVYHLWITQTNATRWSQLSDLSNESHDCTFVNGTRIIYNAQGRFAGSPYHQNFDTPYGGLCHYKWIFQDDDKFLGATSFNKIHQPGNGAGDDASIQREQLANTFLRALGVPWLNRRYVAVFVNGHRRGSFMEDTQTPDSDVVKEHFPNDTTGWLYKMQPWFEFAPFPSGSTIGFNNDSWCNLMPYTTAAGVKKVARYRYNFLNRRTPGSANDFTNVFSIVDAANSYGTPNYVANMENLADMENWMRVFAANHAAGNWDSFGCQNSQNLYGYLGEKGTKYSLLMWDYNIVIGNSGSWGPGQNLFVVNGQDPNTQNIYNNPTFRRMYWRALQELVNGPLNVANSGPLLDAKYNAFVANGQNLENPSTSIKGWLSSARSSISSQIAVENTTSFTLSSPVLINNTVLLNGVAPVNVKTVLINGVEYPVTWTSVTGFQIHVPLKTGTNALSVVGVDIHGQPIAGASNNVSVVYTSTLPSPAGQVVINEIMYNPTMPDSQYVELYNNSSSTTFDLSGWQFNGLAYTFPQGSIIGPNSYLVLAVNRVAFAAAYGATTAIFDTFPGVLQPDGETLTLTAPVANNGTDLVVSKVKYGNAAPWPDAAVTLGTSLQLIDPRQDNWRVGNWGTVVTNSSSTPQWQYVTLTGTAPRPILLVGMHGTAGDVYVDDIKLVAGTIPEVGANLLQDGDFESPLTGPWTVSANMSGSVISTAVAHSGTGSLHVVASSPGDLISQAIWENTSAIVTNDTYTLSYWYLPSTNGSQMLIRLSGSSPSSGQIYSLQDIQPAIKASAMFTPGAANSTLASLPAFPPLWLNELQADNLTGITNSVGQRVPWLELYNPTANTVSLSGLFLSTNYANLTAWAFPSGATINPSQFEVIFADAQSSLSTATELHTSFTLSSGSGSLALSRLYNGQPQVLDYIDYTNIGANHSYGSMPDGQSFDRQEFALATPGATNNSLVPASFIPYTTAGSLYQQNFDSLPDPGPTSVNSANPVTINSVTYSLANPFCFADPAVTSGNTGGLGLDPLSGWYGLASLVSKFGATDGDQTTGGQISFGLPGSSNRALGLLATSSTGATAFGAKFINQSAQTLNSVNIQVTGELWRQSNLPKTLDCHYFVDPTGTAAFPSSQSGLLPSLNLSFPVNPSAVGGVAVDGTASANQISLTAANQAIADWPPGAALWLVWQMTDPTGKAQGLAIDNLNFSASSQAATPSLPIDFQTTATNLTLSWTGVVGQKYQLEYKDDLGSKVWTALGNPQTGTGAIISITTDFTQSSQRFYRLTVLP